MTALGFAKLEGVPEKFLGIQGIWDVTLRFCLSGR
jgi:hypothetical protein